MVLLLRAFTHVDAYAEALELAGLEPYVVGGRGYWSSQQVEDALRLLACVANPLDDEALLGALASPAAAALARRALAAAPGRRPRAATSGRRCAAVLVDEQAEEADGGRRRGAATARRSSTGRPRRSRLRHDADRPAGGGRADAARRAGRAHARGLRLRPRGAQHADGRRRAANLLKLVRMAGEYEAHEGRDLRGFLDAVAARSALSDREAEAATPPRSTTESR